MNKSLLLHRKRPRLEVQSSQSNNVEAINDLWGEEICLNFDQIQEIETQALSQINIQKSKVNSNVIPRIPERTKNTEADNNCPEYIQEKLLQEKIGEVKHLRRELESTQKVHFAELDKLRVKLKSLEDEVSAKQSELKFQEKQTLLLQEKIKVNNANVTAKFKNSSDKLLGNISTRLSTGENNNRISGKGVEEKEYIHDGDLFHDLLMPALYSVDEGDRGSKNRNHVSNDAFFVRFGVEFMKLFRCQSFLDKPARSIIRRILFGIVSELSDLHQSVAKLKGRGNTRERAIQKITNACNENLQWYTEKPIQEILLSNKSLYLNESGIYLRQMMTMLSILICMDPTLVDLLAQQEPLQKIEDEELSEGSMYILVLLLRLVSILDKQDVTKHYVGFISAIVYFYRELYHYGSSVMKNLIHEQLISNSIYRIILSTQSPIVIRCIIKFFISSAMFVRINQKLCHRSDADTFIEDDVSYTFSLDTCALQVLCVQIELMASYPADFIFDFLSWTASFTSMKYSDSWLQNKTDATVCECLPCFEQTLLKVMNNCVEQHEKSNNSFNTDRNLLGNSLQLIKTIFKNLKQHDEDFDVHIGRYQGQYMHLLHDMKTLFSGDDDTNKFTSTEIERLAFSDIGESSNVMNSTEDVKYLECLKQLIFDGKKSLFKYNKRYTETKNTIPHKTRRNQTEQMEVVDSAAATDERDMSVKDFLQSALSQRYFS